ncbi:MAG: class I SAM-dependent rRNA methyltransferase [Myxococcales bacterium]|nr:class I SAM-dependent rRNA methyltransferase [Myxococcota bacterium]MDW8280714.1 class I SAM-dependent rRNA methyltransferase [Myxococcales bacterium]
MSSEADVVVTPRGAARLRGACPLLRRTEVQKPPAGEADVVRVRDGRGELLGTALWCPVGPIALRLLGGGELRLDATLLGERLQAALRRRQAWLAGSLLRGADAYRVVHAEADLLPGLVVDRYGEAAVVQTTTRAMDARVEEIGALVAEVLGVQRVIRRDDGSARDLEALPRVRAVLRGGPGPVRVRFHDAGAEVEADLLAGSKTGAFLDQQENHALAGLWAQRFGTGEALDAFTYHGGFALQLGRAGLTVLACDENPEAVAAARHNAALGGLSLQLRVANAFDLLRELEAAGRRFQVVVLDPPALAKRGRGLRQGAARDGAYRAYKELNLRGLRLLACGGLLITCSCSARLAPAAFEALVAEAARDAGRVVQLLARRGAGEDHPVLLGMPETEYLKCLFLRVVGEGYRSATAR